MTVRKPGENGEDIYNKVKRRIVTMEYEKAFEREVWGGKVRDRPSGLVPARQVLDGHTIILEPLDPGVHGAAQSSLSEQMRDRPVAPRG